MDLSSIRAEDYIIPNPIANSTAVDDLPDELDTRFLHNVLGIANNILLDNPAPDTDPDPITDDDTVISPLQFFRGRKCGKQCSYDGHVYSHDKRKTRDNGHSYFQCKDRKLPIYFLFCRGRVTVLGNTVVNTIPHCHPPSLNKFILRDERIKRTVLAYDSTNMLTYCRSLGHLYE